MGEAEGEAAVVAPSLSGGSVGSEWVACPVCREFIPGSDYCINTHQFPRISGTLTSLGLRVLGYLMLALVAASYYAVVVYAWGPLLLRGGSRGSVAAASLVLAAFHLLVSTAITVMSWFGDAQKLTKALFSFASRLAAVIIFVDEVDSLLGARGGAMEHEATRRMRNEFMEAWDGLRIYVDLPDAQNRMKILKILLAKENLESEFGFDELANATEGYSGSDLKNLCVAAAYKPVHELLEEEKKGSAGSTKTSLRSLKLDEFVQAKAKVSPSVPFDATSMNKQRKWNKQYGQGGSRSKSSFGFGT
ncbi:hypothetical protein ZWY2020_058941 [Hordeum vulgare]|nr:hypothetical protein ZWY2020_058941 [Hordeum vulgare]